MYFNFKIFLIQFLFFVLIMNFKNKKSFNKKYDAKVAKNIFYECKKSFKQPC